MKLKSLQLWQDPATRPASNQMAIDEAAFRHSSRLRQALLRCYAWDGPATTIGYFEAFPDSGEEDAIRRFTGGGIVEHGDDLTFVLAIPSSEPFCSLNGGERYRLVHTAIAKALAAESLDVSLQPFEVAQRAGSCFQHAVHWDLLHPDTGEKIGGGAQRRTRSGVIHQGSLRLPPEFRDPRAPWIRQFAECLGQVASELSGKDRKEIEQAAAILEAERYANDSWNRAR